MNRVTKVHDRDGDDGDHVKTSEMMILYFLYYFNPHRDDLRNGSGYIQMISRLQFS